MRIESKLCHFSDNKAIVQVNGWVNDINIGSALAEGPNVEVAEDKAISRLKNRINTNNMNEEANNMPTANKNNETLKNELINTTKIETSKIDEEPVDWSNELNAIDSEIKKLNWTRDDENKFLEKNLGYKNRNTITKYNELVNYLNMLIKINNSNSSKQNIPNLKTLIEESEIILKELSWDHNQGREYLRNEFNVSTRKELNESQLRSFVYKLKSIRNQNFC
tara:strand:+ start:129 stop:794 length:666 start_codon:yes stop_codon:yes gene_type:complete